MNVRYCQNTNSSSDLRINPVGIQYLPWNIHSKVFPRTKDLNSQDKRQDRLVALSKRHLNENGLLGKKTSVLPSVDFDIPKLEGSTLDEHFYKLGKHLSEPYLTKANQFVSTGIPSIPSPTSWLKHSGWMKYQDGKKPKPVPYPDEKDGLVFDTEVMYKISDFPVLAVACSSKAWYVWVSPWFLGESDNMRQLIPLGSEEEKVVIGHNISYDRKRIKEEYNINLSNTMFLDTMSLHIAVNGMCSRQRPDFQKLKKTQKKLEQMVGIDAIENDEEDPESYLEEIRAGEAENPWVKVSSLNNLADVGFLHCGIKHDKEVRDDFGTLTREEAVEKFQTLVDYCARDVDTTYRVFCVLLPAFFDVSPHPVSFAALRHMSSMFLPINKSWENYIESAESCYQTSRQEVYHSLVKLAETAVALKDDPSNWEDDPWLRQLDWTIKPVKMVKGKKGEQPRLPKKSKLPGFPEWYRALFPTAKSSMNLTVRSRVSVLLLRLQWEGHPLIWSTINGFVFKVEKSEASKYLKLNYTAADMNKEINISLTDDANAAYFKVPHKDGASARCTNPLSKSYLSYFEKGILSSEYELAAKALQLNASCSYWISNRERMHGQMAIWSDDVDMGVQTKDPKEFGMILPSLVPMGTVTRRAVENTWLTASNAKKNRIGSEQKAMVKAPPGYKFVGADVDSEELWIASIMGDSLFKIHGGTALGWMTLEGTKSEGTDLHSKTAKILNISRNEAKVFNYGRIYGAGVKFATQLLKQFCPHLSNEESKSTAEKLYAATKGQKAKSEALGVKSFWRAGSESIIFNRLEEMAGQEVPRTPVLGTAITQALMAKNLGKSAFLTSRVNWTIQSSGVDYLHLLITSMQYLIQKFNIDARLVITVHDEIRYMAKDEDVARTALALQICNLWTRAMFCQQIGINELPYSCAFFSAVDIDHVLRKETDMDCVTPSHPIPIEPGRSLDLFGLLKECTSLNLETKKSKKINLARFPYTPRTPILATVDDAKQSLVPFIEAQISVTTKELRAVEWEACNLSPSTSSASNSANMTGEKASNLKPKKASKLTKSKASKSMHAQKVKQKPESKARTSRTIKDRSKTDPIVTVQKMSAKPANSTLSQLSSFQNPSQSIPITYQPLESTNFSGKAFHSLDSAEDFLTEKELEDIFFYSENVGRVSHSLNSN